MARPRAKRGDIIRANDIQHVIDQATTAVRPQGAAIVAGEGAYTVDQQQGPLRLAQLISPWQWSGTGGGQQQPANWPYADAYLLARKGNEFAPVANRPPIRVWAPAGYPGVYRSTMRAANRPEFPIPFAPGDWVWVTYSRQAGLWLLVWAYERLLHARLKQRLYVCGSASAETARGFEFVVYDYWGRVTDYRWVLQDSNGYYIPSGADIVVEYVPELAAYTLLFVHTCRRPPSSSDSRSDSSTSKSDSWSSGSAPSESKTSSSQPPSVSYSVGSDKSSAIVPASWSPTGYVALFIHEMPEVRFDDVMVIAIPMCDQEIRIDPHFVEVCEKGSIEVCGLSVDKPVLVGARIHGDKLRIHFDKPDPRHAVRLVVRLTGIRRGFAGKRFPKRTHKQFLANEAFISQAYPGDPQAD